jgi:pSer/pThr/pTyr-binding forkhead associated (FHA) protein
MLKLHFKDNRRAPVWVVEKIFCIGREADNHLVIPEAHIDSIHAKILHEDTKYILKDNNSHSGTFVNGQRITLKELLPGDTIKLGTTEMIVLEPHGKPDIAKEPSFSPWQLISDSSWLSGKSFILKPNSTTVIGRGQQCDIVIPGSHLSRRHAEIIVDDDQLRVKDLGSANGTFLNELRIDKAVAQDGDRLRLDVYTFRVLAPDVPGNKTRVRKPLDELAKPIERKQVSSDPRRWKTRPTSPGNRIEPENKVSKYAGAIIFFAFVIIIAILAIYLL